MADIELVIKIPKAEYELIVNDEAGIKTHRPNTKEGE